MKEKRPKEKGPSISFDVSGKTWTLRPDNAELFLYSEMPFMDNFRVTDGKSTMRAFRESFTNFDDMSEYMQESGYTVNPQFYPTDAIYQAYVRINGPLEAEPLSDLTPRKERQIKFARYLLDQEIVTADSFAREVAE